MSKEYKNSELKVIIYNLYNENNITISDELKKLLNKSSRVHYETLYKHYNDIKSKLVEKLINNSDNNSDDYEIINIKKEIIFETNEIEIQTDTINIDYTNKEIKDLNQTIFRLNIDLENYKFKYQNIKKEFKNFRKLKEIKNINYNNSSSDDDIYIKEKKLDYHQIPELSSMNLIQELKKLSKHELKSLYNKYFSNKLARKLNN